MAITLDAASALASTTSSGDLPLTFNHTVSSGSDRLLVVAVMGRSIGMTVTGITFNGDALTLGKAVDADFNQAEIWYLLNPDVATGSVVVTQNAGTFVYVAAYAISFFGVTQTSPEDDDDSNNVNATSISLPALTTVTDACVVVDAVSQNAGGLTMTEETNRTQQVNSTPSGTVASSMILTKSPAGSVTMEWTSGSAQQCMVGVAFKPAAAAADSTPPFFRPPQRRLDSGMIPY